MLKTETLLDIAMQSSADSHKVAAACYDKRGRLLSTAWNVRKTHPLQARVAAQNGFPEKVWLHAEMLSLIRSPEIPYSIHVLRTGPKRYPKASFPCAAICFPYIMEVGIKEILFYTNEGKLEKLEI